MFSFEEYYTFQNYIVVPFFWSY